MVTEGITRAALYMRVSSEDQAKEGTIQIQEEALKRYCLTRDYLISDFYRDDGVTGTLPLEKRPEGKRLLTDAKAGRFDVVIVHKLDRLGRKQIVILNAAADLEKLSIGLISATESFETVTPAGRMMFQVMGSVAELDRSNRIQTMVSGRDRYAAMGRWTGGVVPFGYDLDEAKRLIPSDRLVPGSGLREADIARSIFESIAAGATTISEAQRINAMGVRPERQYVNGSQVRVARQWIPGRISRIVQSTTYKGTHTFKAKSGAVDRPVPALVDEELWNRANARLEANRRLPSRANRHNLLRAMIRCVDCDRFFVGNASSNKGRINYYYRCGNQFGNVRPSPEERCQSKAIPAKWIEDKVWTDIRDFVENPGPVLMEAAEQAKARRVDTGRLEEERDSLSQLLAKKAKERDYILTIARREQMDLDEVGRQLDSIRGEQEALRSHLEAVNKELSSTFDLAAQQVTAEALLAKLSGRLEEIERTGDDVKKRRLMETLVLGVDVYTEGAGHQKQARCHMRYAFSDSVANVGTASGSDGRHALSVVRESMVPAYYRSA